MYGANLWGARQAVAVTFTFTFALALSACGGGGGGNSNQVGAESQPESPFTDLARAANVMAHNRQAASSSSNVALGLVEPLPRTGELKLGGGIFFEGNRNFGGNGTVALGDATIDADFASNRIGGSADNIKVYREGTGTVVMRPTGSLDISGTMDTGFLNNDAVNDVDLTARGRLRDPRTGSNSTVNLDQLSGNVFSGQGNDVQMLATGRGEINGVATEGGLIAASAGPGEARGSETVADRPSLTNMMELNYDLLFNDDISSGGALLD